MTNLFDRSIEIIWEHQHPSGAYIASPSFADYAYCWFRDGSFIAYAMDLVGAHDSAIKFHTWGAEVICRYEHVVARAIEKAKNEQLLGTDEVLHARYSLDGLVEDGEWPNFQLDGLGTWLWSLAEHIRLGEVKVMPSSWMTAIGLVSSYLCNLWSLPNFDCWEENGDKTHTYTLGAIYAGLNAVRDYIENAVVVDAVLAQIKETILKKYIAEGHLIKYRGSHKVDASLIGLATPYRLLDPEDEVMVNTIRLIEEQLRVDGGGVHRFVDDTYYGGGEWTLLTAWLGWYYSEIGEQEKARKLLAWVERQADGEGNLPEQVSESLIDPSYLDFWVRERGEIARPLLWSHAKYLILWHALNMKK